MSCPFQSPLGCRALAAIRRLQEISDDVSVGLAIEQMVGVLHEGLGVAVVVWVDDDLTSGVGPNMLLVARGLAQGEGASLQELLDRDGRQERREAAPSRALVSVWLRRTAASLHWLEAPIRLGGQEVGGLALGMRQPPADEEWPFHEALAVAITSVVQGLRHLEAARREAAGSHLHQRLAALGATRTDAEGLFQEALPDLARALGADAGGLFLIEGQSLRMVAQVGSLEVAGVDPARIARVPLSGSQSARVIDLQEVRQWTIAEAPSPLLRELQPVRVRVVASAVIAAAGAPLGVVHLGRTEERRFREQELRLLLGAAAQLGASYLAACQRQATDAELLRRGDELAALQRVADSLGRTLLMEDVIQRCLDFAEELSEADAALLQLVDESGFLEVAAWRRAVLPATASRIPLAESIYSRLGAPPYRPQVLDHGHEAFTDETRALLRAHDLRTVVMVPLVANERLLGIKTLGYRESREFPQATLATLLAIGEQEAVAIDRARAHRAVQVRARLSATLREVAERVIEAGGAATAEALVDGLRRLTQAPFARLAIVGGSGLLETAFAVGTAPAGLDPRGLEGLDEATWLHGADPVVVATPDPLLDRLGAPPGVAVVALPLRAGGRLRGLLLALLTERRRFHPEENEALRLLGSLAATAIEAQRLRRAAEAEHRHLLQVIDRLPIPIAVLDGGLRFRRANAAFRELTGARVAAGDDPGDLVTCLDLSPLGDGEASEVAVLARRTLAGEEVEPRERLLATDQGPRAVQIFAVPLLNEADGSVEALLALQDVTALRELADAKDRFLAVASHELRSPISSLSACVSLLEIDRRAVADEERRGQLIARIRMHTKRLVRLADDLIDTARSRSSSLSIAPQPAELVGLLREVIDLARSDPAQRRGDGTGQGPSHEFVLEAAEPIDGVWDRNRLAQVLHNLVTNAQRYSPEGSTIRVSAACHGDRVSIQVSDQGIGVPPSLQESIFDAFVRGREAGARVPSGLGLGLFIARQIVRRHGGEILVRSEPGRGSAFVVELPRVTATVEE